MKAGKHKQQMLATSPKRKRLLVLSGVAVLLTGFCIAACAANTMLHGRISVTEHKSSTAPRAARATETSHQAKANGHKLQVNSELTDDYGSAANSPAVAAAIRNAESNSNAKSVSDRYEAIRHGHWTSGSNQMQAVMHGYVPPGMSPQQAGVLYNAIPPNVRMAHNLPQPIISGDPVDPMAGLSLDFGHNDVKAANQEMFDSYMRDRSGPVYVPPLHRDHNASAHSSKCFVLRDNQTSPIDPEYIFDSLTTSANREQQPPRVYNPAARSRTIREMTNSSGAIQSQFSYDPFGRPSQIAGTGPVPDFGYQGYYLHQRSGLNLTSTRAYSPALGRFLNRDPIEELGGINLFTYVGNNPISRQDPSGEMWKVCCKDPTVDCPKPGPYSSIKPPTKCAKDSAGGRTYFIRAFRRGYQKCVWSDNGDPEGGVYACEPTGKPQECPE